MLARRSTLVSLIVCAGVLAVAPGCPILEGKKPRNPVKFSLKRADGNVYLRAQIKRSEGANGVIVVPRDLRAPLRCETTAGLYSKRTAGIVDEALIGMELDTPGGGFPPPQFYGITVQPQSNGASVFAGSHLTAPNRVGETFFADVSRVDLAIEMNSTVMHFFARPNGTSNWTELGTLQTSGQPFPVWPTLGIFGGLKGGQAGFDDFRVVRNGPRPGGLSPTEEVIEDLWEALDLKVDAAHLLDDPDIVSRFDAQTQLENAEPLLDAIIGDLEGITEPGKRRKPRTGPEAALSKARKALRKLRSAISKLDKGKSARSAQKQAQKAIDLATNAVLLLQEDA